MSVDSFQSLPTFCHTTTYLPAISCGGELLVVSAKVPISRAAASPSGFTSTTVSVTLAMPYAAVVQKAWIRARPAIIGLPGGRT